jgi:hypothetical protein
MRKTLLASIFTATVLSLTACGTSTRPTVTATVTETPTPAAKPAADPTPPAINKREITKLAIRMTWDGTSEADRDAMCGGIAIFGTDWAAEQLRTGGGSDATLDWDYAAELVADECTKR